MSTSLMIWEIQVKTTELLSQTCQKGCCQKSKIIASVISKDVDYREHVHCWWECQFVQPLLKTIIEVFSKN